MDRRRFLSLAAAGSGGCLFTPGVGSAGRNRSTRTTQGAVEDGFERGDWTVETTVEVEEDGSATETITLGGSNVPSSVELLYNTDRADELEVLEGGDALDDQGTIHGWDVEQARTVSFRLQLGLDERRNAGVFDHAVVSDLVELVQPFRWDGGADNLPETRYYTIAAPEGWSVAFPGRRVEADTYELTPQISIHGSSHYDLFVVGDVDLLEREVGTSTMRIATMPGADPDPGVDAIAALFEDATPRIEELFDYRDRYPQLALLTTAGPPFGSGGVAQENSFLVTEDMPLFTSIESTYLHEQIHTYQRFAWCSGDCEDDRHRYWYSEGVDNYVEVLVAYEVGRFDHGELTSKLRTRADHDGGFGATVTDSPYGKGALVTAALDVDVRARTGGDHDVGSFLGPVMDQRSPEADDRIKIHDHEALAVLYDVTGVDYTDFYDRYVHGTGFDDDFYADTFSLENPSTVGFAALEYTSIDATGSVVAPGNTWSITFEVTNAGAVDGGRTLELLVDDEPVDSADVHLESGGSTTVTLEHDVERVGETEVRIEPLYRETVAVEEPTAAFGLDDADLSEEAVAVGESVTVTATVRNVGPVQGAIPVDFTVDGEVVDSSTVVLDADATEELTFEHTFDAAGEFDLSLNGEPAGTVAVGEGTTPTDSDADAPGFGLLAGLAGIGSALGYVLYRDESTEA